MTGLFTRLMRNTPMYKYVHAVQNGTAQQKEEADKLSRIAGVHSIKLEGFFERNHFSILIDSLITPQSPEEGKK